MSTASDLRARVAEALATAPPAKRIPFRTALDFTVEDARLRMLTATSNEIRMRWARSLVEAKRARGDYAKVAESIEIDEKAIVALAHGEALRAVADKAGERHD